MDGCRALAAVVVLASASRLTTQYNGRMLPLLATLAVEAILPADGAIGVPTNTRVVLVYDLWDYAEPENLGSPFTVAVDGTDRNGTLVHVGEKTFGGSGEVDHARHLAVFTPEPEFAPGEIVVVTLSTMFTFTPGSSSFVIGAVADLTAPTGGKILEADAFDNTNADDDDPGGSHYFGYEATLAPGADAEGFVFLLLDASTQEHAGEPLGSPYVLENTYFRDGGLNSWAKGRLRIASQAEDLAGNRGAIDEVFVRLPTYGGGCRCAVGLERDRSPALTAVAIGAAAWYLRRRRHRP